MLFVRVCRGVPGFHLSCRNLRWSSTCCSNLRKFNPKAVVWVRVLEPNSRTALLVLFLLLGPSETHKNIFEGLVRARTRGVSVSKAWQGVVRTIFRKSSLTSVCSFDLSFQHGSCEEARTSRWWLLFVPEELRFELRRLECVSSSHNLFNSTHKATTKQSKQTVRGLPLIERGTPFTLLVFSYFNWKDASDSYNGWLRQTSRSNGFDHGKFSCVWT